MQASGPQAHLVHHANHLMARDHAGAVGSEIALDQVQVGAADTAVRHGDAHLARAWDGHGQVNQAQWRVLHRAGSR
ncbi:MAG: hypothetical protein NVSMB32_01720 [Actinomycetota bacterium]